MNTDERRKIVSVFLEHCVKYANDSIERKKEREDSPSEISRWETYRDFTKHAIEEVENGELDAW